MTIPEMTRRTFLGTMAALPLIAQDSGWMELFNGRNLDGWRPSPDLPSWKVVDGQLSAEGPTCHLYYTGPVHGADFKNFELEAEVKAEASCNGGIYFHSLYQESGWPSKGFEVQINNSQARERKKTGSLYSLRNIYKQWAADNEWFKLHILVRGKNVQVRLNGMLVVDFLEPTPPYNPPFTGIFATERWLNHGTFALQCHDEKSKYRIRSIRVRALPDNLPTPGDATPFPPDDLYKRIVVNGLRMIPTVDFHVHLKSGLTLEQAMQKSMREGLQYGIAANCGMGNPVQDDAGARQFLESLKGQNCFYGFQAEGREWTRMFSRDTVAKFDYVITDSMTWTDNKGRRMRLWMPNEVGTITNPQEFMDTLVDRTVGILDKEPVDIYANPTFLPEPLAKEYETLWTEERRKKVIGAAARNGVAIEINDRYHLPSPSFIKMAKEGGCKFTFGTNNTSVKDLGRSEYGFKMVDECRLMAQDFFMPLEPGTTKAVDRKGDRLQ